MMSEKMADSHTESVRSFYAGKSIFVTGGTGFMGKVLLEKLLRSCPEIREIFLLMRPRKGTAIDDRLKQMIQNPLFDILRESNPTVFEKLIAINGDMSLQELGILPEDKQVIIERVSVVFNLAGNIRFDNNLKEHILTNTFSTNTLCIFAENIKNLVAFVHVSTAYAQCDKQVIEEIEYPADTDWRKTVKVVESIDEKTLMILGQKYCGVMPNTYTFSKRLAENVLSEYSKRLPIVLLRPSIVTAVASEPNPGWVDSFQGQTGLITSYLKGFLRVLLADGDVMLDDMPVDVAINIIIAAAWKRGQEALHANPEISVYNCTAAAVRGLTLRKLAAMGKALFYKYPAFPCLWYPGLFIMTSPFLYSILAVILHLIPATVFDFLLKFCGRKPMLSKLQIIIQGVAISLQYFTLHHWNFRNDKAKKLLDEQNKRDEGFGFDYQNLDLVKYMRDTIYGTGKFLLREDVTQLNEGRIHVNRMWWLHKIVQVLSFCLFMWILYKSGFFNYFINLIHGILDVQAVDKYWQN